MVHLAVRHLSIHVAIVESCVGVLEGWRLHVRDVTSANVDDAQQPVRGVPVTTLRPFQPKIQLLEGTRLAFGLLFFGRALLGLFRARAPLVYQLFFVEVGQLVFAAYITYRFWLLKPRRYRLELDDITVPREDVPAAHVPDTVVQPSRRSRMERRLERIAHVANSMGDLRTLPQEQAVDVCGNGNALALNYSNYRVLSFPKCHLRLAIPLDINTTVRKQGVQNSSSSRSN